MRLTAVCVTGLIYTAEDVLSIADCSVIRSPDALDAAMSEAVRASEGVNRPAICVPNATCRTQRYGAMSSPQLTASTALAQVCIADSVM